MEKQKILDKLWADYTHQNPSAKKIYDLFKTSGEEIKNDHIAFRTFNDPRVSIEVLAAPFMAVGYEPRGAYTFEEKHLFARHFEHKSDKEAPRVFISQLILEDFSPYLQETIKEKLDEIPEAKLKADDLIYAGRLWKTPSLKVYEKLRNESEYAAWLYVYGYRANHFTISINALKKYNTIEKVNQFLKDNGYQINNSGGEVKGSPEQLLEQSSTKANHIKVPFTEGVQQIPGCYYEFAKRYTDASGNLYSGFIANSADKIFESTDYYKR